MSQTLFNKLGGFSTVSKVVMDFYDLVLDSDIVGDFFDGINLDRQIDHQTKFISSLLGGPASYTDEQLQKVHRHLELDHQHFSEILTLLDLALQKNGIDNEDRESIRKAMESRRMYILKEH